MPKGSADHAELCTNTDANHTSTTYSHFFFLQVSIILMLTKEYVFVFENFQLFLNSKNEDDLTSASYFTYMNTC